MTTTATAQAPRRGTWKQTHQQNSTMIWFGTGKVPAETGVPALLGTQEGRLVALTPEGLPVFHGGMNTRFWAVPATEQTEVRHHSDGDSIAVTLVPAQREQPEPTKDVQAIQRAARPSRNGKLHPCECGCGGQVKGLYKQGHDARHAGDVARQILAAGSDANLDAFLRRLPTAALRAKAARIVQNRIR